MLFRMLDEFALGEHQWLLLSRGNESDCLLVPLKICKFSPATLLYSHENIR